MLHPNVEKAIDEIDASFFSGDQFHDENNFKVIEKFLHRWGKELEAIRKFKEEIMEESDDSL